MTANVDHSTTANVDHSTTANVDHSTTATANVDYSTTAICTAGVALAACFLLFPQERDRAVYILAIAALAAWLAARERRRSQTEKRRAKTERARLRHGVSDPGGGKEFAAIDPEAYGLRVPSRGEELMAPKLASVPSGLVPPELLALARRVGNQGGAKRLVSALLDVDARCRFIEAERARYAGRGNGRDTPKAVQVRVANEISLISASERVAMDCVQELTMRLPGGAIARKYARIARKLHAGTIARVRGVCEPWQWCEGVRVACAMHGLDPQSSPLASDPRGAREREHMVYP
jgi:hypothetical protein